MPILAAETIKFCHRNPRPLLKSLRDDGLGLSYEKYEWGNGGVSHLLLSHPANFGSLPKFANTLKGMVSPVGIEPTTL